MHGYMLMKSISESCMNLWKPTSGSLYPALEELKEEKSIQVKSAEIGGRKKKIYFITEAGKEKFHLISKDVDFLEKKFLEFYSSHEFARYSCDDFLYLAGIMRRFLDREILVYKGVLLEFAFLMKNGKLPAKGEKEAKDALLVFLKKIKKINGSAK